MCDKRTKLYNFLNEYEDISEKLALLKAREKALKENIKQELEERNVDTLKESLDNGNVYNMVIVMQTRENLVKDKVKQLLTEDQYNSCVNVIESEFIKITKLKEKAIA